MNKGFFWKGIVQMSFRGRRGMISKGEEKLRILRRKIKKQKYIYILSST